MLRHALLALASTIALSGCADLVVTSVHHASLIDDLMVMKATVKNKGLSEAGPSVTRLDVKTPGSAFGQRTTMPTPALPSRKETELFLWQFYLPALVQPSQCIDVRVCADANSHVSEGWFFEDNNCRTRQFCRVSVDVPGTAGSKERHGR